MVQHAAWLLAVHGLVASGCREEAGERNAPRREVLTTVIAADAGALHAGETGTFVERQLTLRIAQFGGSLVATGPAFRGVLAQGTHASHDVQLIANHCYRVLAAGGVEVTGLDLALFGADRTELDEDGENDAYPSLGTARPICPASPGRYRIEVRMRAGQGDYGVVVLRTP